MDCEIRDSAASNIAVLSFSKRLKASLRAGFAMAALGVFATTSLAQPAMAASERPEKVTRAMLSIESSCPLTPAATASGSDNKIFPILGALIAGVAGKLVTSGLNAVGGALESASEEKGYVAEGTGSFNFYVVEKEGGTWKKTPSFMIEPAAQAAPGQTQSGQDSQDYDGRSGAAGANPMSGRCLVLALDGRPGKNSAPPAPLTETELAGAFKDAVTFGTEGVDAGKAVSRLKIIGLTSIPALYVEAELSGAPDGMIVQPVLVRYGEPLPGAPADETAAELHFSFATPGAADTTDIGALFAVARIQLPKVYPITSKHKSATLFGRTKLANFASVVVPSRPGTGSADDAVEDRNNIETEFLAKSDEVHDLQELQKDAKTAWDAKPADEELKAASRAADLALGKADVQLTRIKDKRTNLAPVAEAGSTNVKARFLVIRNADGVGLAIAAALKGQAESVGTAVTEKLTPKEKDPDWSTEQSAYEKAKSAVRTAEHNLDLAIANGETDKLFDLQEALFMAKVDANAAASNAGKPLPYVL